MLIPFPFAFLTGALAFDAFGWLTRSPASWTTGGHLAIAGIAMALVAAVPGFIDYLYTVPPNSTGKRRATYHMAVNLTAVALFGVSLAFRGMPAAEPTLANLGLEIVALGLLSAGGFMGGTLVFRNQIGIDHRYAHAGKWREARVSETDRKRVLVGRADDLKVNQMKLLRIGDRRIVLGRTEDGYVAFDDWCTHRGGSLADGAMICGTVQCPWHGSQFDVRTGEVKAGPAKRKIAVYTVADEAGQIGIDCRTADG
jgi:nitrite reductase/ring-hydroxylating ferredoxin subunit/uncharacterized membrane protein